MLLRLAADHFWISLADSDILLWAQGVATHAGMDVSIREPDVSPLQLQGPKSGEIMTALFGDWIEELAYYWLRETELDGIPLVVSRTGWSSELGYEIYLRDGSRGDASCAAAAAQFMFWLRFERDCLGIPPRRRVFGSGAPGPKS